MEQVAWGQVCHHIKKNAMPSHDTIGAELPILEQDRIIKSPLSDNRWRRTLLLQRSASGSWGFTLQSYGIQNQRSGDLELFTYVDYVEMGGSAYVAGLRPGDVILSIDGVSMEAADHPTLVHYIKGAGTTMRLVVLFEDCCRKVELHLRSIKLHQILNEKLFELRALETQERRLLGGRTGEDTRRLSLGSSASSVGSELEDRLSLLPELDRCPSPLAYSSASGASPGHNCSTPSRTHSYRKSPAHNGTSPTHSDSSPPSDRSGSSHYSTGSSFLDLTDAGAPHSPVRNEYEYYSLPTKGRLRAEKRAMAVHSPSFSAASENENEVFDDKSKFTLPPRSPTTLPRKHINASVSGDISYVREISTLKLSRSASSIRSESQYSLPNRSPKNIKRRFSIRRHIQTQHLKTNYKIGASGLVAADKVRRNPSEPELLSLQKLVSDFRMDYIHNSLAARPKSQEDIPQVLTFPTNNGCHSNNSPSLLKGDGVFKTLSRDTSADSLLNSTSFYIGEGSKSSSDSSPVFPSHRASPKGHTQVDNWIEMDSLSAKFAHSNLDFPSPSVYISDGLQTPSSATSQCSWESEVFETSTPVQKQTPELNQETPLLSSLQTLGKVLPDKNRNTPCRKLEYINEKEEVTRL